MNPGTRVMWFEFGNSGRRFEGYLIARHGITALVQTTECVRQAIYAELKEI